MNTSKNVEELLEEIQKRLDEMEIKDRTRRGKCINSENELEKITLNLNKLIGLNEVKNEVNKLINYLKFISRLDGRAKIDKINLNMLFKGNPGTGKTTVARLMGKILFELGYLKTDKIVETTPREFIAGYVGQTAIKTRKFLDKYKGGLIFIDEAYGFNHNDDETNFSDEAIAEIIKDMEKKETVFIFAGYDGEMEDFVNLNPGIKSRIGYDISFEDYSENELFEIFMRKIDGSGLTISEEAIYSIKDIIRDKKKEKNFGNGRMIDNLYNKLLIEHASITCEEDYDKLFNISNEAVLNINMKTKRSGYFE